MNLTNIKRNWRERRSIDLILNNISNIHKSSVSHPQCILNNN